MTYSHHQPLTISLQSTTNKRALIVPLKRSSKGFLMCPNCRAQINEHVPVRCPDCTTPLTTEIPDDSSPKARTQDQP